MLEAMPQASGGGASLLFSKGAGKPEAYRYVLRQSRKSHPNSRAYRYVLRQSRKSHPNSRAYRYVLRPSREFIIHNAPKNKTAGTSLARAGGISFCLLLYPVR